MKEINPNKPKEMDLGGFDAEFEFFLSKVHGDDITAQGRLHAVRAFNAGLLVAFEHLVRAADMDKKLPVDKRKYVEFVKSCMLGFTARSMVPRYIDSHKAQAYKLMNLFRDPPRREGSSVLGRHCKPRVVMVGSKVAVFADAGNHAKHLTITNDVEWFVEQLMSHLTAEQRVFYYDSERKLTRIITKDGRFHAFAHAEEKDLKS